MRIRFWGWLRRAQRYARLTIPYAGKGWITVDERCYVQRQILTQGSYEPEVWETLAAHADREETVWDVGAHIGSFSIRALRDDRVKAVHAFEPDPDLGEVLRFNLALNPGCSAVHPYALSGRSGTRSFFKGFPGNTGVASLSPRYQGMEPLRVCCRTVDELVAEGVPPPTLMKIDVEGEEAEVLRGARRLLKEHPPKALVVEAECDREGRLQEPVLEGILSEAGYRLERIGRPSGIVDERENYLAIHGC